jgi:hypothetical protein
MSNRSETGLGRSKERRTLRAASDEFDVPGDHDNRGSRSTFPGAGGFPAGEAEVIVFAERKASLVHAPASRGALADPLARLRAKFPAAGTLGPAALTEDPTAPLDAESWAAELKP